MRLAFSTNAYLKYPFDEAAARIASIGYAGLELLADVPHAWPAGLLDGQKLAIRAAMKHSRLEFSNINAFMMNAIADHRQPYWHPSFIEPEPHYRQVRIDHTRRAFALCRAGGASYHDRAGRTARGRAVAQPGYRPVCRGAQAARRARSQARRLAPDRARAGSFARDD